MEGERGCLQQNKRPAPQGERCPLQVVKQIPQRVLMLWRFIPLVGNCPLYRWQPYPQSGAPPRFFGNLEP
jgi:hypothetical protein